eukprot:134724-Hanusia_phi.AAC.1
MMRVTESPSLRAQFRRFRSDHHGIPYYGTTVPAPDHGAGLSPGRGSQSQGPSPSLSSSEACAGHRGDQARLRLDSPAARAPAAPDR